MTAENTAPEQGSALAIPETFDFVTLFTGSEKVEALLATIEAEVRKTVIPTDTDKNRKAIASLAYKVSQAKTLLDGKGKEQVEDQKRAIKVVDDLRKVIRDRMDALRDEARKPLDDWEEAEAKRKAARDQALADLQIKGVTGHSSLGDIAAEKARILAVDLSIFTEEEELSEIDRIRARATSQLEQFEEEARRHAAEQAELEELRAMKAELQRKEAEEQAAKEKADREAREKAEQEERERLAAEKAKQEAADAVAAAERRAREAEEKAERDRIQAEVDAKRREEEAAQRERDRIAEEKRKADADRDRRERNQRARNAAGKAIRDSIIDLFPACPTDIATEIARAALDGKIARIKVEI